MIGGNSRTGVSVGLLLSIWMAWVQRLLQGGKEDLLGNFIYFVVYLCNWIASGRVFHNMSRGFRGNSGLSLLGKAS